MFNEFWKKLDEVNLIVVGRYMSSPKTIHYSAKKFVGVAVTVMFAMSIIFVITGFQLGKLGTIESVYANAELDSLRMQNKAQEEELDSLKKSVSINLDALAIRLGEMQAQAERLDALGGRLTVLAGIDDAEFQFASIPAMGGLEPTSDIVDRNILDVDSEILKLQEKMHDSGYKLELLQAFLHNENFESQYMPAGRPVDSGWLSSRYGYRTDPINGKKAMHSGMDFSGAMGANILAVADGVITWSGSRSGYGNLVEIDHGNGYQTRYAHNQKTLVAVGESVAKGQKIATMGKSGRATGPHVHFEVLQAGNKINPLPFIQNKS